MKQLATLFTFYCTLTACHAQNNAPAINNARPIIGNTVAQPDSAIWVVFQDANGNYWFGSNYGGVYYYNPTVSGNRFVHLTTQHGLAGNGILDIQQDGVRDIYFTTQSGISKFNGYQFTTLPVVTSTEWKLQPGDLWFKSGAGKKGPYRYDGDTLYALEFPQHYLEDSFYKRNPVRYAYGPLDIYNIYTDSKGHVWFGTAGFGVCRYDGKTLSWLYEDQLTYTPGGGSFGIRSVLEDRGGAYWICNARHRYNIAAGDSVSGGYRWLKYRKENGIADDDRYYMSILEDSAGHFWMLNYEQGIYRYDGSTTTHYPLPTATGYANGVTLCKDNKGCFWVGTKKDGLYKFNGTAFEKLAPRL